MSVSILSHKLSVSKFKVSVILKSLVLYTTWPLFVTVEETRKQRQNTPNDGVYRHARRGLIRMMLSLRCPLLHAHAKNVIVCG